MQHTFTTVFVQADSGYIAYVEELPGAHAQGHTLEEAEKNLREAVDMTLAANRRITHEGFASLRVVRRVRMNFGRGR
jgi:predicted RNase H-like HicB family nuclease